VPPQGRGTSLPLGRGEAGRVGPGR
jgi:hypothetical protein